MILGSAFWGTQVNRIMVITFTFIFKFLKIFLCTGGSIQAPEKSLFLNLEYNNVLWSNVTGIKYFSICSSAFIAHTPLERKDGRIFTAVPSQKYLRFQGDFSSGFQQISSFSTSSYWLLASSTMPVLLSVKCIITLSFDQTAFLTHHGCYAICVSTLDKCISKQYQYLVHILTCGNFPSTKN